MVGQQFRNIVYVADQSGTGLWRRIFQANAINCIGSSTNVTAQIAQTPVLDQNYYHGVNSVTVQRWINDAQRDLVLKFLKPIMDQNSGWLIYEIDDNMAATCIPKFNRGRAAFESPQIQENIKQMLNAVDFVTVTTDYIKNFYHKNYGVPLENIIAVPNLLPQWWFGDRYDPDRKLEQLSKFKAKPRIGIVSSLSHYNIDNVKQDKDGKAARLRDQPDGSKAWVTEENKIVQESELYPILDDFDEVCDCIRSTVNDFQWVMFGHCPPKIEDLAKKGKIEVHGGVPLLNYASKLENLQLQAIVAPIADIEFNRCKSFIKTMECAAIGVPLFASAYEPYKRVMPDSQLFTTGDDLREKLLKLKFGSSGAYRKMIEQQWNWLNSPHREGDFQLKNFWLEPNIDIWLGLFKLKQKTLQISLNAFVDQFEKRKKAEASKIIKKSASGQAVITL